MQSDNVERRHGNFGRSGVELHTDGEWTIPLLLHVQSDEEARRKTIYSSELDSEANMAASGHSSSGSGF